MIVTEREPPLGPDAEDRPPREAWDELIEAVFNAPVPVYGYQPAPGLVLPVERR